MYRNILHHHLLVQVHGRTPRQPGEPNSFLGKALARIISFQESVSHVRQARQRLDLGFIVLRKRGKTGRGETGEEEKKGEMC